MAEATSISDVFRKVDDLMALARSGLADLLGPKPPQRMMGVCNLATFGRSVTLVVQNLKTVVDRAAFDAWYEPKREAMKGDALMLWFVKLRNEILKEGPPSADVHTYIAHFTDAEIPPRPPGAKAFFMGDSYGGNGWEVSLPDGSLVKWYVELPRDVASTTLHLPSPPQSHLGQPIADRSLSNLGTLYLRYLEDLVEDARRTFLPAA